MEWWTLLFVQGLCACGGYKKALPPIQPPQQAVAPEVFKMSDRARRTRLVTRSTRRWSAKDRASRSASLAASPTLCAGTASPSHKPSAATFVGKWFSGIDLRPRCDPPKMLSCDR